MRWSRWPEGQTRLLGAVITLKAANWYQAKTELGNQNQSWREPKGVYSSVPGFYARYPCKEGVVHWVAWPSSWPGPLKPVCREGRRG